MSTKFSNRGKAKIGDQNFSILIEDIFSPKIFMNNFSIVKVAHSLYYLTCDQDDSVQIKTVMPLVDVSV